MERSLEHSFSGQLLLHVKNLSFIVKKGIQLLKLSVIQRHETILQRTNKSTWKDYKRVEEEHKNLLVGQVAKRTL